MTVDPEVWLGAGYAVFLVGCAWGLDLLARHTHHRADRYRLGGFVFHSHLDAWECPEGLHLPRIDTDRHLRIARYRASPQACNRCPRKAECTDSDEGREIVRPLGSWAESEAGRFHRAISLMLVALALVVVSIVAARNPGGLELLVLGAALLPVPPLARHLLAAFRPDRYATFEA